MDHMNHKQPPSLLAPSNEQEAARKEEMEQVLFRCGPKLTCPDGTAHDYSKFEEGVDELTGCGFGTAVCSKCGHRAIDDAYWM